MRNKKIEAWKDQLCKGKTIFVATNVKNIHPIVDRIVTNLCQIDLINYVRVAKEDIFASNEIKIIGRTKYRLPPQHRQLVFCLLRLWQKHKERLTSIP
jgi:hypothetical protein